MEDKGNCVSILFICLGNICRSPAAEAVMRKKLDDIWPNGSNIKVDSAGIGSWHEGQLPDYRMRRTGKRHGYDISSRARQIKQADFSRFTYIIGMDYENISDLNSLARTDEERKKILCAADFMTHHPAYHTVPDPYYGDEKDFELALELIEDACDGIIKKILRNKE